MHRLCRLLCFPLVKISSLSVIIIIIIIIDIFVYE